MKIKSLMYVLMGTMLVTTSCSDNELEKGNDGPGTVDPVNASPLVKVYADEKGENLLAEDVFVKDGSSRTITLNVPIHEYSQNPVLLSDLIYCFHIFHLKLTGCI